MAIAVVQAKKFSQGAATFMQCLLGTTTTGNTLVVILTPYTSAGTITCSGISTNAGTVAFAQLGRQVAQTPNYAPIEVQVAPNITGGTTPTLTVNFSASSTSTDIYVYELSGMPTSTTQDGTAAGANQSAATACITPNITTTNAGSIVFGTFSPGGAMTVQGSGWTGQIGTATSSMAEYQIETTTQTNLHATGTASTSAGYGAYIFALQPAASGAQSITPTGIASTNAFGTAVIAPGAVSITPAGIVSTNAFGTAVVGRGAVSIAPAGIASTNAFGTAVVGQGAVSITPAGIASTNVFGTAAVALSVNIAPAGIASTNAFGTASVSLGAAPADIDPIGIGSTIVFGIATVVLGLPPPITVPPYSGQQQPSPMPVNPDIAWRESQPEEGPWVIPPYAEIFPGGEQGVTTDVVPPPISKTDLWNAMQTWPM